MQIVSRVQMLALPVGTVYGSCDPTDIYDLRIKRENIRDGKGDVFDWSYSDMAGTLSYVRGFPGSQEKAEQWVRNWNEHKYALQFDLTSTERDATYDDDLYYMVYEPSDLVTLIAELTACLPPSLKTRNKK